MDQKIKEAMSIFAPCVDFIYKNIPDGFSKDMALSKIQEGVWWAVKAFEDESIKQKAGTTVEAKKD